MSDFEEVINYTRSTCIRAASYSEERQILVVEFVNGKLYQHNDVPSSIVDRFQKSNSLGKFYNEEIKGRY